MTTIAKLKTQDNIGNLRIIHVTCNEAGAIFTSMTNQAGVTLCPSNLIHAFGPNGAAGNRLAVLECVESAIAFERDIATELYLLTGYEFENLLS